MLVQISDFKNAFWTAAVLRLAVQAQGVGSIDKGDGDIITVGDRTR